MYHDEFARKPVRSPVAVVEDALATLALEMGGGLSITLVASMAQPVLGWIYMIGGLLPLVVCSTGIFIHRCTEILANLGVSSGVQRPTIVPVPHFGRVPVGSRRMAGPLFQRETVRAGFDRSAGSR